LDLISKTKLPNLSGTFNQETTLSMNSHSQENYGHVAYLVEIWLLIPKLINNYKNMTGQLVVNQQKNHL
jgi:hypothetical protein